MWPQFCVGLRVCGPNAVWASEYVAPMLCGPPCMWPQCCVGLGVCGPNAVWASECVAPMLWASECVAPMLCGPRSVWPQCCGGLGVCGPNAVGALHMLTVPRCNSGIKRCLIIYCFHFIFSVFFVCVIVFQIERIFISKWYKWIRIQKIREWMIYAQSRC